MKYKFIDCQGYVWLGDGYRYDPVFEVSSKSLVSLTRALQPKAIQRVS